jgi:hypothetical protein
VRQEQYGDHTIGLFAEALHRDVVSRGDVLDYLDVSPHALSTGSGVESAPAEPD